MEHLQVFRDNMARVKLKSGRGAIPCVEELRELDLDGRASHWISFLLNMSRFIP